MSKTKFPIVVPNDITIMDETQLINYVVDHTCDEMRDIMVALVFGDDSDSDVKKDIMVCVGDIKQAMSEIDDAINYLKEMVS